MTHVHFVGSIGLGSVEEVFDAVGESVGKYLKRCPDGETGGRRLWISWQYPLLRANPYLKIDESKGFRGSLGMCPLKVADDVNPREITFGELGYAREARASYLDFLAARKAGKLGAETRFQVCLPTPFAVISTFIAQEQMFDVLVAYERAMIKEVQRLCAAIPHEDLALQWDVCIEMLAWDGRWERAQKFEGVKDFISKSFVRLCELIPADVELGFHLCYGDLDAKHFIDPLHTGAAVDLANTLLQTVQHKVAWIHLPVPADRDDEKYFEPLKQLKRTDTTELYLGLVHAADGVEGAVRRMRAARKVIGEFGIATECGISRAKTPQVVVDLLKIHAQVANAKL